MAALTAQRSTKSKDYLNTPGLNFPVAASTTIYKGSLVMLDAGFAKPAATAASKKVIGRAKATVVNSGAAGAASIEVEEGIFKWANDGGDAVVAADVGATVYATDDQTVSRTATGKTAAGICQQLESDGVWVKTVL